MSVSEGTAVKVIRIEYEETVFLINRAQSSSSIFASGLRDIPSSYRYVRSLIEVDGSFYLLFDLDRYLGDTFGVARLGSAQLAVLSDIELFSETTAEFLRSDFIPGFVSQRREGEADAMYPGAERIAFLIASNAAVKEMELSDFAPHPAMVQNHLIKRGVMAAGFGDRGVRFLIDLERLIDSKELLHTGGEE